MSQHGGTQCFYEKTKIFDFPRESDFNFRKFGLTRAVYVIKKYHIRCLKLIWKPKENPNPGNLNFEIPRKSDQNLFTNGFRMFDLVVNRFWIITILKHKRVRAILNSGIEPNLEYKEYHIICNNSRITRFIPVLTFLLALVWDFFFSLPIFPKHYFHWIQFHRQHKSPR